MYNYINGTIMEYGTNFIVLENNNIGYQIYVSNPYKYKLNETVKLYLYNHVREEEYALYGFKTKEEKELFFKLISVKGLGPKMAMPIIATDDITDVIAAIETDNITYLKKFPKIGDKVARQIILDLKGKLVNDEISVKNETNELVEALESLGYKNSDIKKILPNIDSSKKTEEQLKDAFKLLLK